MEKSYEELDMRMLFHAMFRKTRVFFFSYLAVAVLMASYIAIITLVAPTYRSEVLVYVSVQQEDAASTQSETEISVTDLANMRDMTNTFLQIIRSNRLAEKVIRDMNLGVTPTQFIEKNLRVETIERTPFLRVSVKWDDAKKAHEINGAIVGNITQVLREMHISGSLVVVDAPTYPQKQDMPGVVMLAAVFVVLGFAVGFVFVLLGELMHPGFRTEEDVEKILKLTNYGVIPK